MDRALRPCPRSFAQRQENDTNMFIYKPPLTTLEKVEFIFPWLDKLWKVSHIPLRGNMSKKTHHTKKNFYENI